jgi:acyl carrier protein
VLNLAQITLIFAAVALVFLPSRITPMFLAWPWHWWVSAALFLAGLVCGFFAVKLGDKAIKQHVLDRMIERRPLNEQKFGSHYFSSDRAEIAAKLRKILANHIDVDLSRMAPTDRFIQDLRMDDLDSMSTVEYVIEIEKEFGIKIPDSAAEKMITFQSIVDYVAEAVKSKAN